MTIAEILGRKGGEVVSAATSDRVVDVIGILAERRIGAVPVLEDGRVVGIFSERDVLYGLAREGASLLERSVGEVMTSPPITVDDKAEVLAALSMMTHRRVRHLPVVVGESLNGMISIGDLVKFRIDRIEAEADAMRQYIQTA